MSQQKCFALSWLDPAQCKLYLIVKRHLGRRVIRRCTIEACFTSNHPALAFRAACAQGATLVNHYLIEPRSEPVRIATLGKIPIRTHERELQRVVRILHTPQHVRREASVCVAIPANENAIRVRVAGKNCRYDAGVRAVGEISIAHEY
jgi:hypothetical protein